MVWTEINGIVAVPAQHAETWWVSEPSQPLIKASAGFTAFLTVCGTVLINVIEAQHDQMIFSAAGTARATIASHDLYFYLNAVVLVGVVRLIQAFATAFRPSRWITTVDAESGFNAVLATLLYIALPVFHAARTSAFIGCRIWLSAFGAFWVFWHHLINTSDAYEV